MPDYFDQEDPKDPLGILTKPASKADPLGILKKKVGGNGSSFGVNPFDYSSNGLLKSQEPDKNKWVKPRLEATSISQAIQKDKEKNNSWLGGVYNNLVGSVARLAGGITELGQSVSKGFIPNADVMPLPSARKPVVDFVEKLRTGKSSRENEQRRSQFDITNGISGDDVKALLFQAPSQLLDMVGGAMTYGSSFFLQAVNDSAKELEESPNADKLTNEAKLGYTYLNAVVQGTLDYFPVFKVLKSTGLSKKVQQKLANEITDEFIKKGIKATAADIEKAALAKASSFASKVKKVGLKAATGFGYESVTETGQQMGSDALKILTNKISKNDIFDEEDIIANFGKNAINAGVQGGAFGTLFGGGSQVLNSTNKSIRNEVAKAQTPEDLQNIQTKINEQVELGNITPEEAQAANIKAEQYAKIAARIPETVEPEKKYAIIGGIEQRDNLENEISKTKDELKTIDPAFHKEKQDQIDLLKAKLDQTNDYIEGLVTGKKTTYRKEGKEGEEKYIKTDSEGKETEIPKEYYELATAIREEEASKKKEPEDQPEIKTNVPLPEETETTPKSEQVGSVVEGKEKVRVSAEQMEERQPAKIRERYIDDFNIVEDSKFDWRVTSELSTADRKKAVADIKAEKDTAAARKLNKEIDETLNRGTVIINRGRGNQAESVEIPIDEWFKFTPIEHDKAIKAAESAPDEVISIIRDNDITLDNIDSLKQLFNGFPYDETDFNNVKTYLQGEATRTSEAPRVSEQIEAKELGQPTQETKTEPPTNQPPPEKPPTPPEIPVEQVGEGQANGTPKALVNRLMGAKNLPDEAKKAIEKEGLTYEPKDQETAEKMADSIIDELGLDEAVSEAQKQTFSGDVNSFIQTRAIEKLNDQYNSAKTTEEKFELANKQADIAIKLDEWLRGKAGRGISALARFYKMSPLGAVIKQNKVNKSEFNKWSRGKDESWDEFLKRLNEIPEFKEFVSKEVQEGIKKERAEARKERIKKVDDAIDGWIKDIESGKMGFVTIVPPPVIIGALKAAKVAYKAGEHITKVVQDAIDTIAKAVGDSDWNIDGFRKKAESILGKSDPKNALEKYKDRLKSQIESLDKQIYNRKRENVKKNKTELDEEAEGLIKTRDAKKKELEAIAPLSETESYKLGQLEKMRNRLKGLTEEQKDDVIRKSFQELIKNGALNQADFRKIIANATGRGDLTPEQSAKMKELVKQANSVEDFSKRMQEKRTPQSVSNYLKSQYRAAKAARELSEMFDRKQDYMKVIATALQGNTLTATNVLFSNPLYNIINQTLFRLPNGALQSIASLIANNPEFNTVLSKSAQGEFFKQLGKGTKEAAIQLATGLNRADFDAKDIYESQIRPMKSGRELWHQFRSSNAGNLLAKIFGGKEVERIQQLSGSQKMHRILEIIPGTTAEINFRLLNFGDKPLRYGAGGATAAGFANKLGIEPGTMDWKIFMLRPKEETYRILKERGVSDKEASEKAEYTESSIIQEGKVSVLAQDNLLTKNLEKLFGSQQTTSGLKSIAKSTLVSPFTKITSNAVWQYFTTAHPLVAVSESAAHLIYSYKLRSKGENVKADLQIREARRWLGHAAVGIALNAIIIPLVKNGIITGASDEDDAKKEREGKATYEQQGQIDFSKLGAWMTGKDPDSVKTGFKVPLRYFGAFGTLGNSAAKNYENMTNEERETENLWLQNILSLYDPKDLKVLQDNVFSNTAGLLGALNGDGYFINRYFIGLINLYGNLIQPGAIAQISRAQLPYYTTQKADSFAEQLDNSLLQRSSWYRNLSGKMPPAKYNIWGDRMDKDKSIIFRMLGFSRTSKDDNFAQPLFDDAVKYNDDGFFPPVVTDKIGDNKLTAKQYEQRQQLIGVQRKVLAGSFINDLAVYPGTDKKYSEMKTPEEKKKALNFFYDLSKEIGDAMLFLIPGNENLKPVKKEKTDEELDEQEKSSEFRQEIKDKLPEKEE